MEGERNARATQVRRTSDFEYFFQEVLVGFFFSFHFPESFLVSTLALYRLCAKTGYDNKEKQKKCTLVVMKANLMWF